MVIRLRLLFPLLIDQILQAIRILKITFGGHIRANRVASSIPKRRLL